MVAAFAPALEGLGGNVSHILVAAASGSEALWRVASVLTLWGYALSAHHIGEEFGNGKETSREPFSRCEKRDLMCVKPPHLREVRSM
jgi:hypothetical protein